MRSTRSSPHDVTRPRLLFVSHNASQSGAPAVLLAFERWLVEHDRAEVATALLEGGPLTASFREVGPVVSSADLAAAAEAADLVYLNSIGAAPALRELTSFSGVVITHVHEQGEALDRWISPADRARLFERTTRFVAVSRDVESALVDRGVDPDRVRRHHGFVDVAAIARNGEGRARRGELGVSASARVIGASGTTEWRKAPDLFLALAAEVRRRTAEEPSEDIVWCWVGGAAEGAEIEPVLADRRRLGLDGVVHFLGERTDALDWFDALDVFVLPSRVDPFPLVVLEASVLGVPVVAFDSAGSRELLEGGVGVVVPYPDVSAMADAVVDLLHDPERRHRLGAAAAERVRERHDLGAAAARLWSDVVDTLDVPAADG